MIHCVTKHSTRLRLILNWAGHSPKSKILTVASVLKNDPPKASQTKARLSSINLHLIFLIEWNTELSNVKILQVAGI